ncbi:cyclohexanone monooxygenase [Hyaloraphidium curvatum]|nr:cyclohexanone monooxygenase [Hyaloraphidium curvatum]
MLQAHRMHNIDGKNVRVFERSDKPGGTWNWNRYPGARVDVISADYTMKHDPELYKEWSFKEVYAPQPELMEYIEYLMARWKLAPLVQFESNITDCIWDEKDKVWTIKLLRGKDKVPEEHRGRHLVLATGCLSAPQVPKFEGLDEYKGEFYHTGQWPREGVDFTGKKVAVIGTGSSAVQSIPIIAQQAEHLTVFQRTPTYTAPAYNRKLTEEEVRNQKVDYAELCKKSAESGFGAGSFPVPEKAFDEVPKEELDAHLDKFWAIGGLSFGTCFTDLVFNPVCNDYVKGYFHRKIKSLVKDPSVAEKLLPSHPVFCKRLCVDTDYYITYNRPNVSLVSIKDNPIAKTGGADGKIVLKDGSEYGPFDAIVFAIGFDAMTGSLDKINIVGREGRTLKQEWEAGPVNYLGLFIHGFPNMYHIAGPGSPSVLTNMLTSIEHHTEWVADAIKDLDAKGVRTIEATEEAQKEWVGHVNMVAGLTIFPGCNSWYLGANIPGKPRVFMPLLGFPPYVAKCAEVKEKNYEGCVLA